MNGFSYFLLSLHRHDEKHTNLLNRVFEIWEQTFSEVAANNQKELDPDEFFRSHHVGILMFHEEIVGFNLFTMFDLSLSSNIRHRYFQALGSCSPGRLSSKNVKRVLTMEYFTILPQWRRQAHETPWGEILTGLGLKFLDSSMADAVVGTPRIDLRVHEMCYRLGAYDFQEPVQRLNYECAVVLFPKMTQRTFVNPLTQHWVKKLPIAACPATARVLNLSLPGSVAPEGLSA